MANDVLAVKGSPPTLDNSINEFFLRVIANGIEEFKVSRKLTVTK